VRRLLIVDRIIESFAVCEDERNNQIELSLDLLPEGVREGDALVLREGSYHIDGGETERRRGLVRAKLERLKRGERHE
jgi:hypothetical protein